LSFELISQVLVFKYVLYVPLGIDHDTWQQTNLTT
jgi:hypothetical protein